MILALRGSSKFKAGCEAGCSRSIYSKNLPPRTKQTKKQKAELARKELKILVKHIYKDNLNLETQAQGKQMEKI